MAKRYRIQASDGKWESMNEEMFDYNVLVFLNRATRTGDWVSVYELSRIMYARPNARTFQNVRESLERARNRREARTGAAAEATVFQIIPRRSR